MCISTKSSIKAIVCYRLTLQNILSIRVNSEEVKLILSLCDHSNGFSLVMNPY